MYIRTREGLGGPGHVSMYNRDAADPSGVTQHREMRAGEIGVWGSGEAPTYTPWWVRLSRRLKSPYLRFLNLDRFGHNKLSLTADHRNMLDTLVKHVEASWKTTQPIVAIHLIGHTDNTGTEKYNIRLGDQRARAVEAELLGRLRRKGLSYKVAIVVEPSRGQSKPTADNRTEEGRAANRRVEVFIKTGVLPSVPGPTTPIDLSKQAQEAARRVEEEAQRRRQQQIYNRPIPTRPPGKSISHWLDERFGRLPKKWRERVRNALISGACAMLEALLGQVVGQLSEEEKEGLRKECLKGAKKPA
jgi:outer membrane protein OmpA-like peptidoglycan-associated protein